MFEKLVPLGLTNTEAKIYVTLIDLGRAQAGIISRKSGIHRRSVYDALERLIEKGLVSYIKENLIVPFTHTKHYKFQKIPKVGNIGKLEKVSKLRRKRRNTFFGPHSLKYPLL